VAKTRKRARKGDFTAEAASGAVGDVELGVAAVDASTGD
jgi:hypothetical protein